MKILAKPKDPQVLFEIRAIAEKLYISAQTMIEYEPCGELDSGGTTMCGPTIRQCITEAEALVTELDIWFDSETKRWEAWCDEEMKKGNA